MKRLMLIALALIVAPAMANVTIDVVPVQGECAANIVVTADGSDADVNGSLVAGIAIDVTVDAGVIAGVEGFKTTGESVVGDKGYGIYLGTIVIENDAISDVGTPVAPATDPGALGGIGTAGVTLELGALYDQAVPAAAPEGTTVLCKIILSETATVSLAANQTRGGVVLIGGGNASSVAMNGAAVTCGDGRQYVGPDQAAYDDYLAAGQTIAAMDAAWARAYQCEGDVMNDTETFFKYRVYINDLNNIISNWKKLIATVNPAADVDHASETFFKYRCYIGDLNKVIANWKKLDAGLAGNCNTAP